jgi:hypothetical protein
MGQDHYNNVREANTLIDEMLTDGEPVALIYYKINTRFGFSKKFVDKRVQLIQDMVKNKDFEAKSEKKGTFSNENDLNSEEKDIFSSVETIPE